MGCWRITKYNSAYLRDDWISYSDIEKRYNNVLLTAAEYLKIEDAYILAVKLFLELAHVTSMRVIGLEKHFDPVGDLFYSQEMIEAYTHVTNFQDVTVPMILIHSRLILREDMWCKFESDNVSIHFGYDYYMYIGSNASCDSVIEQIRLNGLFVEPYRSPYLKE